MSKKSKTNPRRTPEERIVKKTYRAAVAMAAREEIKKQLGIPAEYVAEVKS